MTQMDSKARIVLRGENSIYCRNLILLFTKRNVKKLMRDGMGREEGGRLRMGNICIPVADSF